jgi:hypothetical protein
VALAGYPGWPRGRRLAKVFGPTVCSDLFLMAVPALAASASQLYAALAATAGSGTAVAWGIIPSFKKLRGSGVGEPLHWLRGFVIAVYSKLVELNR